VILWWVSLGPVYAGGHIIETFRCVLYELLEIGWGLDIGWRN